MRLLAALAFAALADNGGPASAWVRGWPAEQAAGTGKPEFQPGAGVYAKRARPTVSKELLDDYLRKIRLGYGTARQIVLADARYAPALLSGLLSDDERVARRSFQLLCDLRAAAGEEGAVRLEYVYSPYYRGTEFDRWVGADPLFPPRR